MVVKTELCSFSETRIYPGKGSRFVTRGGQLVIFSSSKVDSLYHQRKKPAKLVWTQAWRRMHKKLNVEATQKRKARKVVKLSTARGFVGMDAAKLKEQKRPAGAAPKKAEGAKVSQPAVKEAKEKAKAAAAEKKKLRAAQPKAAPAAGAKHAGRGR